MERAGLTTRVCVMQAGMESYVIKVSDKKLNVIVTLSQWLIFMPSRHIISTEVELSWYQLKVSCQIHTGYHSKIGTKLTNSKTIKI
jgi:hypothetical protein